MLASGVAGGANRKYVLLEGAKNRPLENDVAGLEICILSKHTSK